jgi:hypothetical protein
MAKRSVGMNLNNCVISVVYKDIIILYIHLNRMEF